MNALFVARVNQVKSNGSTVKLNDEKTPNKSYRGHVTKRIERSNSATKVTGRKKDNGSEPRTFLDGNE